jgi:hypothetical protein
VVKDSYNKWNESERERGVTPEESRFGPDPQTADGEPEDEPEHGYCSLCNPRPDEHDHIGFVFCDNHDREDLIERLKAEHEARKQE